MNEMKQRRKKELKGINRRKRKEREGREKEREQEGRKNRRKEREIICGSYITLY